MLHHYAYNGTQLYDPTLHAYIRRTACGNITRVSCVSFFILIVHPTLNKDDTRESSNIFECSQDMKRRKKAW